MKQHLEYIKALDHRSLMELASITIARILDIDDQADTPQLSDKTATALHRARVTLMEQRRRDK